MSFNKYEYLMRKLENAKKEGRLYTNEETVLSKEISTRVNNKEFNLGNLLNIFFKDESCIDNEMLGYFKESYSYGSEIDDLQVELDVLCEFITKVKSELEYDYPPFYLDTNELNEVYFKYKGSIYYYFKRIGQGVLEGIVKGDSNNRRAKYVLNLDNLDSIVVEKL